MAGNPGSDRLPMTLSPPSPFHTEQTTAFLAALTDPTPLDAFYPSMGHADCLERLHSDVTPGTLSLVTGQSGLGKSLLARVYLANLPGSLRPIVINTLESMPTDVLLLKGLLAACDHPSTGRTILDLSSAFLDQLVGAQNQSLLIIDDAHLLTGSQLETLRTLLTEEAGSTHLAILLVGEEPIRERIDRKRSLAQSIRVHHVLNPLNASDSAGLLHHRLATTGLPGSDDLFTDSALTDLHHLSLGNPAALLQAATEALQRAVAAGSPRVGNQFVHSTERSARSVFGAREHFPAAAAGWNQPDSAADA